MSVQQVAHSGFVYLSRDPPGPRGTMIKASRDTDSLAFRGFPRP